MRDYRFTGFLQDMLLLNNEAVTILFNKENHCPVHLTYELSVAAPSTVPRIWLRAWGGGGRGGINPRNLRGVTADARRFPDERTSADKLAGFCREISWSKI
jgi:hypothetical protein